MTDQKTSVFEPGVAVGRTAVAQQFTKENPSPGRLWAYRVGIALALAVPLSGVFIAPTRELVGLSAILLMFVLMLMRIPIAFALAIPGLLGVYSLNGIAALANLLKGEPLIAASQWALSVLPMFVLMGLLLWQSGITTKMYETARNWLGWLPGGLGVGTNMAGAGLAAVSGSTMGTTYALARIGIPEMLKAGYGKPIAIGSVIVAGLPGQLIPPSIFLVVVAGLLENPVGPQLMAGLIPGITVALLFSLMIVVFSVFIPKWAGRGATAAVRPTISWSGRWRSLADIWPVAVLILVVLGGMFMGVFTATEAGAAGAFGALIFCVWFQRKNKPLAKVGTSAVETVSSVGSIFLMIAGAHILGSLVAVSGLGRLFSDFVSNTGMGRVEFLILVMFIYILLGMFMDPLAILLTTIPILMPVLNQLGVDPLWFGVFAVFMGELAILTPPVGMLSFVIHKIVQDPAVNLGQHFKLTDVFKAVMLFLPMAIIVVLIWIFFPEIVTWLPNQM
ncbi:TRAP transporter large permease [Salinibacterium sp. SWN248]|uniref:TRAP transporter large permease n=1 Tax=Salinibacterium sp. SWN248 TaxID=2792056 RepID=UPI0018CE4A58|nr:TRAP transporter large permease subunit [Salinibacterium sp. SWN248]MBH0023016.1 TRAP transporter large permease subunit [Salinibacterium sp. SWN248]